MMMIQGIGATLFASLLGIGIWYDWKSGQRRFLALKLAIALCSLLVFFGPAFLHSSGDFLMGAVLAAAVIGGSRLAMKLHGDRKMLLHERQRERERQAHQALAGQRRQERRAIWKAVEKQRKLRKRARRRGKR